MKKLILPTFLIMLSTHTTTAAGVRVEQEHNGEYFISHRHKQYVYICTETHSHQQYTLHPYERRYIPNYNPLRKTLVCRPSYPHSYEQYIHNNNNHHNTHNHNNNNNSNGVRFMNKNNKDR